MKITPVSIVIPYKIEEGKLSIWMQKRETKDDLFGALEFPGGKIESGEDPSLAATREIEEETGVLLDKDRLRLATIYSNSLKQKSVCLYVYVYIDNGEFSSNWYLYEDRKDFIEEIPPANQAFLDGVLTNINPVKS